MRYWTTPSSLSLKGGKAREKVLSSCCMLISCSFQLLSLFYLNHAQLLDQTNYSGPGVIGEGTLIRKGDPSLRCGSGCF